MSLVAYDSSDDSEEEITSKKIHANQKKAKEGVKIRIPSLKEFEDDEEAPVIKKPKLQSGSGLLGLLPPPKNGTTLSKPGFVPHILSSKKEMSSYTSKESKNCTTGIKIHSAPSVTSEDQDSDEEIPVANEEKFAEKDVNASALNDFFWLDDLASKSKSEQESFLKPTKNNDFFQKLSTQSPSTSNSSLQHTYQIESVETANCQQYPQPSETNDNSEQRILAMGQAYSHENVSTTKSVNDFNSKESLLNDKEFLKLQGRRREFENIDIIDVNADDQLTDRNEWLMKNLTEESTHTPSRKKHNMPTQQQRRKHQITYLAFQAKERENDLKNQWALNSRTRRETQAKYGF